jgi:hypothetical protein
MEFEPSIRYLISLVNPSIGEEEASEIIREAIYSTGLIPNQTNYEFDEFIRICEELRKRKEGRIRIVGLTGITQARCYRTLQGLTKIAKSKIETL